MSGWYAGLILQECLAKAQINESRIYAPGLMVQEQVYGEKGLRSAEQEQKMLRIWEYIGRIYIYVLNVGEGVSRREVDLYDLPRKPEGKGSVRVSLAAYLTLGQDVPTGKTICSGRARVGKISSMEGGSYRSRSDLSTQYPSTILFEIIS